MTDLDEIRKRLEACPIPEEAQADWEETSHYEIQTVQAESYWWLILGDSVIDSTSEYGKRLGAILDYACAYRRDVGVLLECVTESEALISKLCTIMGWASDGSLVMQAQESRREFAEEQDASNELAERVVALENALDAAKAGVK